MRGDIFAQEELLSDYYNLDTGEPLKTNTSGFLKAEIKEYMKAKSELNDIDSGLATSGGVDA